MKIFFHYYSALVSILLFFFVTGTYAPQAFALPPEEFEKVELAAGLEQPTSFAFAPDGRIFVTEKGGAIKIVEDGQLHEDPLITLVVLNTEDAEERGLLGIEVDPDFGSNGHIYVAYTTAQNFNRLSRLTVVNDIADPASEIVLLESNQPADIYHHGGEVQVGPDGKLWWALGMNTHNQNSQDLTSLHGKLLRINKDGSIPTDNPFYNTPNVRKEIWTYGLRNPFRFTFLPSGQPIVGDVGGSSWEEVNIIEKGGNYGWPVEEGVCDGCSYVNPIFAYPHDESGGAITSALVYSGNTFPQEYQGVFFYGDYTQQFIRFLRFDEQYESVLSDNVFDSDAGTVVKLEQGPDGNIYQLNIYPGALYKIALSDGNRAPIANASADPIAGLAPLTVTFSSQGSNDPEGEQLTYEWDFGDGQVSTDPNPTHIYEDNGTYTATLTVNDGEKTAQTTLSIAVGNSLPTATITTPLIDANYNAGDVISFSGTGQDAEDGTLPESAFSWKIVFHHNTHIHPYLGPITDVKSGTFETSVSSDNVYNTWYEVSLTVTDSGNLSYTTSVNIYPNLTNLQINTSLAGLHFTVDGVPFTSTLQEEAVVGTERVLSAQSPQFIAGTEYEFLRWSDSGFQTHTITTPSSNAVYTAEFIERIDPPTPWTSADIGNPPGPGFTSLNNNVFTIKSMSGDIWGEANQFHFAYQPLVGDGEIIARVISQDNTSDWAKSGVMIKESTDPASPYAFMMVTPDNGYAFQYTDRQHVSGGAYTFPNAWVKLTRQGDTITSYKSADGTTWQEVGSTTVAMQESVLIGLASTSRNGGAYGVSQLDNVQVNTDIGENPESVPSPWQSSDIGSPDLAGSATFLEGSFSLKAAGNDVWGNTNQFHFVHQTLEGDGEIVARVTSQDNTSGWAKAGVMIKESLESESPYAFMMVTPDNGFAFQFTPTQNRSGGQFSFPNAWVKLKREGNIFSAYSSQNGTDWTLVGSGEIAMQQNVQIGLANTAHNGGVYNTSRFDNVTVSNDTSVPVPSPWQATDVGAVGVVGESSYLDGTYTVSGAGGDIWADTDEFHFVHQPLAGDGSITARITSQDNTNGWAKAGVMMKDSLTPGSSYIFMGIAPEHGFVSQHSFNTHEWGRDYTLPNAWVKLEREENSFTAYRSSNGQSWVQVGPVVTLQMESDIQVGLFSHSHDNGVLSASTFDSVEITTAPIDSLPSPWQNVDIGNPSLEGSAAFANNVFTIKGAGNDIWGTEDEFHYVYQTLVGDGEISARITAQDNTSGWAKSGVMMKESTGAGSPYAFMGITPEHGYSFQHSFNTHEWGRDYTLPNAWVKLKREGNQITAYKSADGETWSQVGSPVTIAFASDITIGLFVNSKDSSVLNTTIFDNVVVTQ